jgi:hypothetical protein
MEHAGWDKTHVYMLQYRLRGNCGGVNMMTSGQCKSAAASVTVGLHVALARRGFSCNEMGA